MPVHRPWRYLQGRGSFLDGQAREVTQLDDVGHCRIQRFKFAERCIEVEKFGRGIVINTNFIRRCCRALEFAAVLDAMLAPRLLDENAPHRLGGGRKEMPAALPRCVVAKESQVGLVHQRGGLQGLTRTLTCHARLRETAKLAVDERQQLRRGVGVARLGTLQQPRNLVSGVF